MDIPSNQEFQSFKPFNRFALFKPYEPQKLFGLFLRRLHQRLEFGDPFLLPRVELFALDKNFLIGSYNELP